MSMRTFAAKSLLWVGLTAGVIALAVTSAGGIAASGNACKTSGCTYIDISGQSHPGKCGSKKKDAKNCYCFDKEDNKLSEVQAGCSLPK